MMKRINIVKKFKWQKINETMVEMVLRTNLMMFLFVGKLENTKKKLLTEIFV